jgi:hypothetical protein
LGNAKEDRQRNLITSIHLSLKHTGDREDKNYNYDNTTCTNRRLGIKER